ncbi:ribosomal protein S18-alanine N-acetyltransferase [Ruminococcus flavefaciens]|uniref:Ribosomal-protein-alanine N-acetyltransferase n=1 Tax=Ruminococcus flavefaciens TaxID=1265 RepID=A0A1M7LZN9_RUMFL|nr:ribosomal protein S18-alanine N-acetyltransferase [Ruminococcus flavefaciens]SHM83829.1 ribosomal-protein-alanine N-acetyltransferase [Ruminococcus flavefaciens]
MEIKRLTSCSPSETFEALSALDKLCVGADGWSAESFREEAQRDGSIILAAYDGEKLAGLLTGFTAADTGEILSVAVSPEYRRKGIARMLMNEFFAALPKEAENIALEVRCSNTAAIALYESFGFVKAGVRKRFYRDPIEDADIMVCYMTDKYKEGR